MLATTRTGPRYEGLKVTREQYLDLPDDGYKYDVIDGVMHMSPSAFYPHNRVAAKILRLLDDYLEANNLGETVPETDVFLPDGGDPLRPDISVLLNASLDKVYGHIHGAPDIVVEVLSESTRERDLDVKADRYLATGVQEYWVADPEAKTLEIWVNDEKRVWLRRKDPEIKSQVLPGLKIDTGWIFGK